MKNFFLPLLLAVLTVATDSSPAVELKPPAFVPSAGLQLSVTTGGYKFFVGDAATSPAVTAARVAKLGALMPTRDGFAASAILANASRTAIPFQFADAGAAAVKFKFSVFDADGTLVWQSDTDSIAQAVITPATLSRGERWKRVIQIPLKVGGAWLMPGIYTLEATLAATPSVSAATIFEVANLPGVPVGDTGISGNVFALGPAAAITHFVLNGAGWSIAAGSLSSPARNAAVSVEEIRLANVVYDHPAFSWTGTTDSGGNFKVVTPPGNYSVTARATDLIPHSTLDIQRYEGTATVSVEKGRFASAGIRVFPVSQALIGIRGLVLIGPLRPVEIIGQSNEQPLANARVEITRVEVPDKVYTTWTLSSGSDGKFILALPPGKFRVTASAPNTSPPFGVGSADVEVPVGGVADVTVHVDSGIR